MTRQPAAVARQSERDALDDVLARMEAEHGPADERDVAAILGRLELGDAAWTVRGDGL